MQIGLDRTSEIPLGVQLGWALRARVLGGHLAPGDRLPPVRELAGQTGVNVNTVRSVYARLEAEGLIRSEQGRGTFVAETPPVDERLAGVTLRALEEARTAGLDPRDVAIALYARMGDRPAPASASETATDPTSRRQALRAEIAALERAISDERLARALRDQPRTPPRSVGGRLLAEDELRAQRDQLAAQLAAIQAPPPAEDEPEPEPALEPAPQRPRPQSATRPGVVLRSVFGT